MIQNDFFINQAAQKKCMNWKKSIPIAFSGKSKLGEYFYNFDIVNNELYVE